MDDIDIRHLNLTSPIYYQSLANTDPFDYKAENGESIFCFELNEAQRLSFEPDKNALLGPLAFCGKAAGNCSPPDKSKETEGAFLELPAGHYLFAQKREFLNREDIITMALEIQVEGLWQRLKPGERLWLRYLFEDGSIVTQLFRPLVRP